MFDAIAGRYDLLNHLLSAGIDRRWRKRAIQALSLTGRERVLDLCAGTADLAISAIHAQPRARVVGVDFADAMLRVGQEKIKQGRLSDRISLVRGDATRVPLADGAVDAVTIGFGIRNVESTAAACGEMHRVLAAGGRIAILEFIRNARRANVIFVVLQPRPAAPRAADFASRLRVRIPPGIGRCLRLARRVCDNPAATRFRGRRRRPPDLWRCCSIHREKRLEVNLQPLVLG